MWLNKIELKKTVFTRKTSLGNESTYIRNKQVATIQCDNCNVVFERDISEISKTRRNNLCKHYCNNCNSYKLAGELAGKLRNQKYSKLIGKKIKPKNGYYEVYVKGTHTYRPNEDWVREHIIVMENHLNRRMNDGEVVHHIDGNKLNNDLNNLDVCTIYEHNNCHAKIEQIVFELYKIGIVGYDKLNKKYFLIRGESFSL